ncbi:hypothetical protein Tco_1023067, partial [Tanacetum coccineum]
MTDAKEMWDAIKSRFVEMTIQEDIDVYLEETVLKDSLCIHEDANQKFPTDLYLMLVTSFLNYGGPNMDVDSSVLMICPINLVSLIMAMVILYENEKVLQKTGRKLCCCKRNQLALIKQSGMLTIAQEVAILQRAIESRKSRIIGRMDAWTSGNKDGREPGKKEGF